MEFDGNGDFLLSHLIFSVSLDHHDRKYILMCRFFVIYAKVFAILMGMRIEIIKSLSIVNKVVNYFIYTFHFVLIILLYFFYKMFVKKIINCMFLNFYLN